MLLLAASPPTHPGEHPTDSASPANISDIFASFQRQHTITLDICLLVRNEKIEGKDLRTKLKRVTDKWIRGKEQFPPQKLIKVVTI